MTGWMYGVYPPVWEWREELVALGRQAVRWGEEREVNWGRWPGEQVHRPSVHTAWATLQQEGPHLARCQVGSGGSGGVRW